MSNFGEEIKAAGLTQKEASFIVGLSPVMVNRQVKGRFPLSSALIYLVETWPQLSADQREKIISRISDHAKSRKSPEQ